MAGDASTKVFVVDIASNTNISGLKNKIKEALHIALLAIDATDLELFKVSLAPEELNLTSDPLEIESAVRLLQPLVKVSDVFDDLDAGKVHVIVLPPCKLLLAIDIRTLD